MTAGGTAAGTAAARLDGGDATAFANKARGVEKQFVGVGNILDVEQLHQRVALGVEVLVHIFQNGFNANLLAVAHAPDRVERQTLRDGALQNEHGGGAAARDEVDALGVELRDWLGEDGVVPTREQADAVGADEGTAVFLACVQNLLLQQGALVGLLAEAGGNDDEGAHLLLSGQILHVLRTILRGHHEDGQVGGRQLLGVVEGLDALHLVFLRVDDAQYAFVSSALQVSHHGAAGLVHIV